MMSRPMWSVGDHTTMAPFPSATEVLTSVVQDPLIAVSCVSAMVPSLVCMQLLLSGLRNVRPRPLLVASDERQPMTRPTPFGAVVAPPVLVIDHDWSTGGSVGVTEDTSLTTPLKV